MPRTLCIGAYTLRYIEGGAYFWAFLHWALGLRALGFHVIWLDSVLEETPETEVIRRLQQLKLRLAPFGMATDVAVVRRDGSPLSLPDCQGLEALEDSELSFSQRTSWHAPVDPSLSTSTLDSRRHG